MKLLAIGGMIGALVLAGCGKAGGAEFRGESARAQTDMATGSPEVPAETLMSGKLANGAADSGVKLASREQSVLTNRMVIRTAQLTLRVDNVEKAEKQVQGIVAAIGGYVDNATSSDLDSTHPSLTISMRVPAQAFDGAMSKLEALGVRTSKSISSQDVTEQVVDMDARIKSMLAQEETFRGMLKRATRMDDVISLQQQLTDLRGQIESIMGQRASLAKQAALSTISLTLSQGAVMHAPPKDPNWLGQTWAESTSQMGGVLRSVASLLIWLAVFSPFWVPVLWLVARGIRGALPKRAVT